MGEYGKDKFIEFWAKKLISSNFDKKLISQQINFIDNQIKMANLYYEKLVLTKEGRNIIKNKFGVSSNFLDRYYKIAKKKHF